MEKAYKTMSQAGAGSIVIGIITIVTGVTAGIIAIVKLGHVCCKNKSEITF